MQKVTCFIIAPLKPGYTISKRCFNSVLAQDWGNFDILIHYEKPESFHGYIYNLYRNCSKNREIARQMALTTDSEYFLVLDDDIILPKNAISEFMIQIGKKITTLPIMNPKTGTT